MNNLQTSESSTASKCSTYLKYAGDAPCWSYQAKTEDSKKAFFDLAHTWAWAALPPEAPWIRQDGAQAASVDGGPQTDQKATAWGCVVNSGDEAQSAICGRWRTSSQILSTARARLHKNHAPGAIRVECGRCPLEVPLAQGKGIGHKSIDSSAGRSINRRSRQPLCL